MPTPHKIPLRFDPEFLDHEWQSIPEAVLLALRAFLAQLQSEPDNPELKSKCQIDAKGRLGHEFTEGYVVYWHVVREEPGVLIDLESFKPVRIDIIEVCRIKE